MHHMYSDPYLHCHQHLLLELGTDGCELMSQWERTPTLVESCRSATTHSALTRCSKSRRQTALVDPTFWLRLHLEVRVRESGGSRSFHLSTCSIHLLGFLLAQRVARPTGVPSHCTDSFWCKHVASYCTPRYVDMSTGSRYLVGNPGLDRQVWNQISLHP